MSWQELTFGNFAEIQPQVALDKGTDYSFIEMADVVPHTKKVIPRSTRTWKSSGGSKFENGDIIFARITPCLEHGKTAKVSNLTDSKGFGSTEFFVFRGREGISDPDYIYYLARSPVIREPAIKSMTGASGRQRAQKIVVENTSIRVPGIQEQRRIASILSTYDNLIENNQRRIQLLEQSAQLLYKEWFVHLRFPGHEHVTITNGVPEEWEKKPLGEIAPLNYGKALKKDDRIPGPFPVFGSSGIIGTHEKSLVSGPAIIVGRKGNVGSTYWSQDDFYPIDTVYFIEAKYCSIHLYHALLNTQFINTDVAVPGLNRDFAHSRLLLVPDNKILALFEQHATEIYEQINRLTKYNQTLTKARDLLLPRLMNGEVSV